MTGHKITRTLFLCAALILCAASVVILTICSPGYKGAPSPRTYTSAFTETTNYPGGGSDTLTETETLTLRRGDQRGKGEWTYTLFYIYRSEYENAGLETVEAVASAEGKYDRITTLRVPENDESACDTVVVGTVSKTNLESLKATLPDGRTLGKGSALKDVIFESEKDFTISLLRGMGAKESRTVYFYANRAGNTLLGFDTEGEG